MKQFRSGWTALDVWQRSPCSFIPVLLAARMSLLRCWPFLIVRSSVSFSHPDKNKDDAEAAKHFMDVNDANEVLSDPDKRAVSAQ
jgi:hypothetical protein